MGSLVDYIRNQVAYEWTDLIDRKDYLSKATDQNYPFMQGRTFTDEDLENIEEGKLFAQETLREAQQLEKRLILNARRYMDDWSIPMSLYRTTVDDVDNPVCVITHQHKITGATICLTQVYFDAKTGEILQCVLTF